MIGKTISHYEIVSKLGEGGMGVVYKAQDTRLDRNVAIKFLPPELSSDAKAKRRFIREAKAASALNHANIAVVHEIDETPDGQMFMVMACYEGQTLKERLERGPLQVDETIEIISQVASGLSKAHEKGILHRDIKPGNILMGDDGQAKLSDFGLASLAGQSKITKTGTPVGTIAYMSPEQARGEGIGPAADIWSLGVCLYEMLTGALPFEADFHPAVIYLILHADPKPINSPKVPAALKHVVEKTMAKQPEDRYHDVRDLASDLLAAAGDASPVLESAVKHRRPSIAVLPFTNLSADREQEYFCDGITEDIMSALARVKDLHVAARTSSFLFRDRQEDIHAIGTRLKVDTLLEGSVRKVGQRLRVNVQLVSVTSGYHIWSEHYDHELKDVFSIQDEITRKIVQALAVELTQKEKQAMTKVATRNVEAYDFYLRGRKFFYQRRRKGIDFALQMFSQAIACDEDYALAYAGIADCYSFLYMYFERDPQNLDRALQNSEKALELDAELAESHAARGLAVSLDGRHPEAMREFETSIGLNPTLFEAYYFYGRACRLQGELEKAAELFEKACLTSPEDYQAPVLLGLTYKQMGDASRRKGAYHRALAVIDRHLSLNPDDSRAMYLGAAALVDLGDKAKSLEWIERALSIDPTDPVMLYNAACVYAQAGRTDDAMDYLEKAFDSGYANREWVRTDPDLESVRNHPRFAALIETS